MCEQITRQKKALRWIIGLFKKYDVPYQIVGGLAVLTYGGSRKLNDIDVYIDFSTTSGAFFEEIQRYVTWGPETIQEQGWDLKYLKANYGGQKLEIADSATPTRIKDGKTGEWFELSIDFNASELREVFNQEIMVMPAAQLSSYKIVLGRPFDLLDVAEIQANKTH